EKALTIAVDFEGITSGDENAIIDLTAVKGSGSVYGFTLTQDSYPETSPILSRQPEPKGGSIAVALNMAFLSSVVSQQISPQIQDTPIHFNPDVTLMSVGVGYGIFDKPSRGLEDGLAINFHVRVEEGPWFGVDGTLFVQTYLQSADGSTEFVYDAFEGWRIYIGKVDVDLPGYIDVA